VAIEADDASPPPPPPLVVNNSVHKKQWSVSGLEISCLQFIERTESVGGKRKNEAGRLKDNPRRLGKGRVRLVDAAPLKAGCKSGSRRQDSPVPLAAFARCQYTRKRNLAARSD
jgi:hypothetical protein